MVFGKKRVFLSLKKTTHNSPSNDHSFSQEFECGKCQNSGCTLFTFHLATNATLNLTWNICFQEISRTRVPSFTRASTERKRQERLPLCYFLRTPRTKLSTARFAFFSFLSPSFSVTSGIGLALYVHVLKAVTRIALVQEAGRIVLEEDSVILGQTSKQNTKAASLIPQFLPSSPLGACTLWSYIRNGDETKPCRTRCWSHA